MNERGKKFFNVKNSTIDEFSKMRREEKKKGGSPAAHELPYLKPKPTKNSRFSLLKSVLFAHGRIK